MQRYIFTLLFIFFSLPASTVLAASYPWQGSYVGAYFGGGLGNNHLSTTAGNVTDSSYFTTSADIHAVNNGGTFTHHPSSIIAGIQAGHDWARNQIVYGVVFDYGALPLNSSKRVSNLPYPDNSTTYSVYTSMSTNWLLTLRGRLGYQAQLHWQSLLYLTGGLALTQLKINNNYSDNSSLLGAGRNSNAENKIGWAAGAGIELLSHNNMSINVEYLYVQVPSVKTTSFISNTEAGFGIPVQSLNSSFTSTGQFHASLLKIGLNYRFDE